MKLVKLRKDWKIVKKIPKKLGRPSIMNDRTLSKLKTAFKEGATDDIACQYAMIAPETFYRHLRDNEHFKQEIDSFKHLIRHEAIIKIRRSIKDKTNKSTEDAKWWLERKYPSEFSNNPNTMIAIDNRSQTNYIDFVEDNPVSVTESPITNEK